MVLNKFRKFGMITVALAIALGAFACGKKDDTTDIVVSEETGDVATPDPMAAAPPTADPNGTIPDGQADPDETAPAEPMSHEADFQRYQGLNSDVFGWLSVPNTKVEYPVVVTTDNEYYLTHNVEKKPSKSGAVFMDAGNSDPKNQRNIILYGHNMNNGTMFNTLNQYKDKAFFENNKTIYFYNGSTKEEYEVYAAFNVDTNIFFHKVAFNSDEEFLKWANELRTLSKYKPTPDVELQGDDQILTLATCTYEYNDQRYVVQARKVK